MELEKQIMEWAAAVKGIPLAEHCRRAKAYEKQAEHYDKLAEEARRFADIHRKLAEDICRT